MFPLVPTECIHHNRDQCNQVLHRSTMYTSVNNTKRWKSHYVSYFLFTLIFLFIGTKQNIGINVPGHNPKGFLGILANS